LLLGFARWVCPVYPEILTAIRDLSVWAYTELQRAMAGGQRIFEVIDAKYRKW